MRNPLSVEAFADWCAKKPSGEAYEYFDCESCAFAQYAKSIGFEDPAVGGNFWFPTMGHSSRPLPHPKLNDALCAEPHTFGALNDRLRSLGIA